MSVLAPSLEQLARQGAAQLTAAGVPNALRDAFLLARWAAELDAAGFALQRSNAASLETTRRFERAIAQRASRMPLSHITGRRAFFGREFRVDGRVLDPRPESETLVAAALEHARGLAAPQVIDLGVGSACLLLSVLLETPGAVGLGVDVSEDALAVAELNARLHKLTKRARFQLGDWLKGIDNRYDILLCNPPYIGRDEVAALEPEVRDHEPLGALSDGCDGLESYRVLAPQIADVLTPEGAAFFELGRGQAEEVRQLFAAQGLRTSVLRDLGGVERVVRAEPDV